MQEEEAGISLKDMMVYCFLHWRSALVIVLCGAILGGGYYAFKGQKAATTEEVVGAVDAAASYDAQVAAIEAQKASLAQRSEYYDNSLLMQIDPNNEYVARADIMLGVDAYLPTYTLKALTSAYKNEIRSSVVLDSLARQMSTSSAYLRELISIGDDTDYATVHYTSDGVATVQEQVEAQGEDRVGILTLTVIGSDASSVVSIRDALLTAVEGYQSEIAASVAEHTMKVSNQTEYTTVDPALLTKQSDMANSISTTQTTISTNEKNLTTAKNVTMGSTGADSQSSLKLIAKGALIGGFAAFLLYGFVLCLRYAMGKTPQTRGQIEGRYVLPEMGAYAFGSSACYAHNAGFDRWLRRIAGMDEAPAEEAVVEMVAANVRLYAKDAKTILVSSSVGSARAEELAAQLKGPLGEYAIACANDLVDNPAARERLKGADAVIFVEEYGHSVFEKIDDELTLVAETGKKPLGLVMA